MRGGWRYCPMRRRQRSARSSDAVLTRDAEAPASLMVQARGAASSEADRNVDGNDLHAARPARMVVFSSCSGMYVSAERSRVFVPAAGDEQSFAPPQIVR